MINFDLLVSILNHFHTKNNDSMIFLAVDDWIY